MHFPGLKVVVPATAADAKGLMSAALREPNPVLFHSVNSLGFQRGEVPLDPDFVVPIGKGVVRRTGSAFTLVTYGSMVERSLAAAERLAAQGIEAEVIDLRSLRPLDMGPVLESFRKTFRAVIVEEGYRSYGIGAEVAARLQEQGFDYMDAPIKRVAQFEVPLPYSRELEQSALINKDRVIAAVKEVL